MGNVIAISNLKGGIGKTTTVVNVGAGLALKGARVLLVDVDAQGNLAMALNVQPRRTIYEVMVDNVPAEDCITPARPNLDLIAGDQSLLGAQPIIAQRADWSRVLERGLKPLFNDYDFIFIDSGGSLTPLNINALMCAKAVIAPTAVEHFSVKGLELLFEQVSRVKGSSAGIKIIVPTLYDSRVRQSSELLAELQERYGTRVAPPIRVNVRLSEAPRQGQTIYEYDPRSRGAADYAALVERISEVFGFVPGEQRPTPAPRSKPLPHVSGRTVSSAADRLRAAEPEQLVASEPAQLAQACPNCGRPLEHATLAGYHVTYCNHCKYKTQKLVREPRR